MYSVKHKAKSKTNGPKASKRLLNGSQITSDRLQSECAQEARIAEYFGNQRIREVTVLFDDLLILQRTIGYPCMEGNQQWIGGTNCYICQRW